MIQEIKFESIGTVRFTEYELDQIKKPDSAKITIKDASEVIINDAVCVVDADGNVSYLWDTTDRDLGFYTGTFKLTYGTDVIERSVMIRIVMTPLVNTVITQDVVNEGMFLKDMNFRKISTAESGSVTEINDANLTEFDNWFTSGTVEIIEGTNSGAKRNVKEYIQGKITVDVAFTSAIDNTSKYLVIKSYHQEIARAFEDVVEDINAIHGRSSAIIDSNQIKTLIIFKAIEKICMNFSKEEVDIWHVRYNDFNAKYEKKLERIKLFIDQNQDGVIDDDEIDDEFTQVQAER